MIIYYLMAEAVPHHDNPESKEYSGAYINCWVKADTPKDALHKAKEYICEEHWSFVKLEDIFTVQRERYLNEPDSLEAYDNASRYGLGAIFYTWPIEQPNKTMLDKFQFV